MDQAQCPGGPQQELDRAAFERVWRRVMPEDRPDCPFTLPSAPPVSALPAVPAPQPRREPAPAPTVCLGEASAADLPRLEVFLRQTAEANRLYRTLARRVSGGKLLSTLAAEKKRQAKRLAAAYFLISGQTYTVPPTPMPRPMPFPLALRDRFQAEQRLAADLLSAAGTTTDMCLADLYQVLAAENRSYAQQLWGWIEQM